MRHAGRLGFATHLVGAAFSADKEKDTYYLAYGIISRRRRYSFYLLLKSREDHGQIGSTSLSHTSIYCTVGMNAAIVLKCSTMGSSPSPRAGDTCTILVFFASGVACRVLRVQPRHHFSTWPTLRILLAELTHFRVLEFPSMWRSGSSCRTMDVSPMSDEQNSATALSASLADSPTISASRSARATR